MERVLIDRLSGSFPDAEPPLRYLIGCYHRACEEGKRITSIKDKNLRSEIELAIKQAKRMTVSYCRIHLANPDMFGVDSSAAATKSNVSLLLPYVFGEVESSVDAFGGGASEGVKPPPGFIEEFFRDSDFYSLDPIFKHLYEDMRVVY